MVKNSIFSVVILMFSVVNSAFAQSNSNLNGVVKDGNNKGVDLAMVSLQRATDSVFVKSEFTDEDGSFTLSNIPKGDYFLQVNLLGYDQNKQSILVDGAKNITVPIIHIKQSVEQLNAVTVTAKKPYIERKIDRTVVNVDAFIANEGSDILEVMERAPGISLDNDGGILLKGRGGVAVFINDKPSYLSGSELQSYLKSLPAGSVQSIEIMTNPPAKYDAAGNSGVINIVLKKNKLKGFNGNISASFQQGRYSSSNNSLNLNYNNNKLSLYANVATGFWNGYQDLNINRYYLNDAGERQSSFEQNSFNTNGGRYINSKVGMDYYLNDNTTIGVSYRYNNTPSSRGVDNNSIISDNQGNLNQTVVADNSTERIFRNHVYNAYFNHKLDSLGSSISVDADYVSYTSGTDQLFYNYLYDASDSLTFKDRINGDIPSDINIYGAKTDFTKVLSAASKLEAGLKTAFTQTDNEAIYSTTVDGITEPDYKLSNRFLYDEWINAGYLNYSHQIGPIGLQMGLRVESTQMKGNQLGNQENPDTSFTRNYTNAFPTFYASWKMDSIANNVLTFSYGRRINRPFFQDLNPFISPLDKFTFYSGNPNLLPTFSHNLSLAHTFKNMFTTSLNYSKTVDGINETLEIRDGIYYSRPGNIANSQTYTISFEGSIPVKEWYTINGYAELSHLTFDSKLYTQQLNSKGTYYYFSATNSFKMKKGWSADLSGQYRSDMVYAQLKLKSYGTINFGVKKNILNNAGSIKLSVNDILKTRRGDGIINNLDQTKADWNSTYDSRTVRLAFSWRFGKSTLKKPKYNSVGSSDEQNRIKG
jgi:hypothetical protein